MRKDILLAWELAIKKVLGLDVSACAEKDLNLKQETILSFMYQNLHPDMYYVVNSVFSKVFDILVTNH